MVASLLLIMWQGLLPGLLCVCLGFLGTRWLSPRLGTLTRSHDHQAPKLAAALMALIPVVLIALLLPRTRGVILDAPATYRDLLAFMARTVMEFGSKLPPDIAAQLPRGAEDVQRVIAAYLASKAGTLATTGRAWLSGLLFAFVGLLIGVLAAARPPVIMLRPLAAQLHLRLTRFGETFRQIVVAQFWIALFNTFLTAVFLLVVLPLWDSRLPYSMALILLTFVAGLVPIVGNLICNGVLTLVGLSVSPVVALACLAFLVAIHKAEYFINAKVIGHRTHMGVWELLSVMFVMEAVFGPAGLVAAPLFYAYAKKELQSSGWV
ncbi:AI-2E family transporter [Ottowia testudinis]|uniref:AI-2E family transporter n=1 Tax=Ottowia testudinis TaxID=2816950 RepID=A0A975CJH7_9BURK|nr:AI-2E family transporter [Ottowia testudinis]QTD47335.1 AI-2E family transporter [Ottowia testudinis]